MMQLPMPMLLLRPHGSRSRSGVITPDINGTVNVVSGMYGQAWEPGGAGSHVLTDSPPISAYRGALAVTLRTPRAGGASYAAYTTMPGSAVGLVVSAGPDQVGHSWGLTETLISAPWEPDTWTRLYIEWDGPDIGLAVNSRQLLTATRPDAISEDMAALVLALPLTQPADETGAVESLVAFDRPLTESERGFLMQMDDAWTWDAIVPPPPPPYIPSPPPAPATYASFPEALAANDKWSQRVVLIDGVPTRCTDVTTRHSRDTPIATCRLMLDAPIPSHVQPGARVEVQAGYSGVTATVFSGYIPTAESVLDTGGGWVTISAVGWLALCVDPPLKKMRWQGPIALKEVIRSILRARKVPYTLVDDIVHDNGQPIQLGVNPRVNEGVVEISETTGLQTWMAQTLGLFGYAIFDQPDGTVRVTRISGRPTAAPVMTVEQGKRPSLSFGRTWTTDGMVTYPNVLGATYTDEDGAQQRIRSFPETVELNPVLRPLGFRKGDVSSAVLDTLALAAQARFEVERNKSELITGVSWKTELAPHIQIGDVVRVVSPTVGASEAVWVTSVSHTTTSGAVTTTAFEGVRGTGDPRPGGIDSIDIVLRAAPVHLGDEHISWYAVPAPSGRSIRIPFTVPDDYFSLKITCLAHGVNSYLLDGENTESTVSRFIIHQNGEEVGSGNLPSLDENYALRLPYGSSDKHWSRVPVLIPGRIEAGSAELEIVAGEDSRLPASTKLDDFEVKQITLTASGVGMPAFVGEV